MSLQFTRIYQEILDDETPELEIEGARYSGKTWTCCEKVRRKALKYPGIIGLIGRFTNEETKTKVIPEFRKICSMQGTDLEWDTQEHAFLFPPVDGLQSKVYAYGLKTQSATEALAKVRGLSVAFAWLDQTEEVAQPVAEEIRFGLRQPGYPHQLIFSPNPVGEDHFLSDQFPEENPFPHRKYIHVSLYDNAHNLPPGKIEELEALYPPTHAKYKSLILGLRGPNVIGIPIYGKSQSSDAVFDRAQHLVSGLRYHKASLLLEAVQSGQHHPVWLAAQLGPNGGLELLGGILGKRMFLEDFMPVVHRYRLEWFDPYQENLRLCSDPPPSADAATDRRFTSLSLLRDMGFKPRSKPNATAPDVRESVIQTIATMMRRYNGFAVNADPTRWLTVSSNVVKQSKSLVDSLEGSYVWSPNFVSVAHRQVRQPMSDQWIDGWMRALENITLNFCLTRPMKHLETGPRRQAHDRPSDLGWLA
jgi:hypothetical protein